MLVGKGLTVELSSILKTHSLEESRHCLEPVCLTVTTSGEAGASLRSPTHQPSLLGKFQANERETLSQRGKRCALGVVLQNKT